MTRDVLVRERASADVAALVALLAEQQGGSRYPLVWPLPFPVEDFIVRDGEIGAWVAELDGVVVGHVSVQDVGGGVGAQGADGLGPVRLWTAAHGCGEDELGAVSALFVGAGARGTGVGRMLLEQAVETIRACGRRPCLDVLARSAHARAFYTHLGWEDVGIFRPEWLPDDEDDQVACVLR